MYHGTCMHVYIDMYIYIYKELSCPICSIMLDDLPTFALEISQSCGAYGIGSIFYFQTYDKSDL